MGQYIGIEIGFSAIKACLLNTQNHQLSEHKQVSLTTPLVSDTGHTERRLHYVEDSERISHYLKKLKHLIEAYKVKNKISGIWLVTHERSFVLTDVRGKVSCSEETSFHVPFVNYLVWQLTGQLLCHTSTAANSPYFDKLKLKWTRKGLKKQGLDHLQFPALTHKIVAVGSYEGIEVFVPLNHLQTKCYAMMQSKAISQEEAFIYFDDYEGMAARVIDSQRLISEEKTSDLSNYYPYRDSQGIICSSKAMSHVNFEMLTQFINQVGRSFFGKSLSEKDVYCMIDQMIQKELFSHPQERGATDKPINVSLAHLDKKNTKLCGKIEGLTADNTKLSQLLKRSCDDTIAYVVKVLDEMTQDKLMPVTISGSAFERIHYLKAQMKSHVEENLCIMPHDYLTMKGVLKLTEYYEADRLV